MKTVVVVLLSSMLLIVALIAIWAEAFRDNWMQWAGLWGMVLASVALVFPGLSEISALGLWGAIEFRVGDVSTRDLLFISACLAFAMGTLSKYWRRMRPHTHARDLDELSDAQQVHVVGGRK